MTVSELLSVLQRVQQVAGDVPVIVKDLEHDAETVLQSIGLHIDPSGGQAGGSVVLEHATAKPADPTSPEGIPAGAPAIDPTQVG